MSSHEGRVAVVTGAGRGIGQAVSVALARRGADVVAVDLADPAETVALIQAEGRKAIGLIGDVSQQADTERVGREIAERAGRCDILVNNAGIYPGKNIFRLDFEQWRQVISVNLDSQFLMVKAVLDLMCEGGWGRIVNVTSNTVGMTLPGFSHYIASKMGVIGFTRGLANDLADRGVTVNAVGPTLSRTPGVALGPMGEEALKHVASLQAIKRTGEPSDVVGAVLFLTSDDAAFITGQTLMADGGLIRL